MTSSWGQRATEAVEKVAALLHRPHLDTVLMAGTGGAMAAYEARAMRAIWPGVTLHGWEPIRRMRRDAQRTGFAGTIYPATLAREPGTRTLVHQARADMRASLYGLHDAHAWSSGGQQPPEQTSQVEATTLQAELQRLAPLGATLLWLDAEGAELEIIEGGGTSFGPTTICYANIELCFVRARTGAATAEEVIAAMHDRGYAICGMHSCRRGNQADAVFCCRAQHELIEAGTARQIAAHKQLKASRRAAQQGAKQP